MRRLLLVLSALVLALSACGGGADSELTVSMYDTRFEPAEWSVAAGEDITLTAVNAGFLEHEFLVVRLGGEIERTEQLRDADVLFTTGAISGQATEEFTFTVTEPGTYQVICSIDNHFDGGMAGTLAVEG